MFSFPLGFILRDGIAGSYGSSDFLRNLHTIFHSGCTSLHFHEQYTCSVTFFSTCWGTLFSLVLLIISTLTGVRWCLTVVLICILLMITVFEHIFTYLLAISMSSWEERFLAFCPCLNWMLCLFLVIGNWRRKWQPTPVFLPAESHG